ncbi:MAG: hypothetical protein CVV05_00450 [Gammaproteobacteria bacterium HGW-Gammaproteobacteria-1]|jgi:hypothetical protein|nr:MAG: hypothetical protein CVV05_00450 [Gammaproteobacteria bacterium HGW-Gammaproteobacteria-1]
MPPPKHTLTAIAKDLAEATLLRGDTAYLTALVPRRNTNDAVMVNCAFATDTQKHIAISCIQAILALENAPYYVTYAEASMVTSVNMEDGTDRTRYPSLQDHPEAKDVLILTVCERCGTADVSVLEIQRKPEGTTLSPVFPHIGNATGSLMNLYDGMPNLDSEKAQRELTALVNLIAAMPGSPAQLSNISLPANSPKRSEPRLRPH